MRDMIATCSVSAPSLDYRRLIKPASFHNKLEGIKTSIETVDKQLDWTAHNSCAHIPNAETIAAMEEADRIVADPNRKRFKSVAEIIADLEAGDDDAEE